MKRDGEISFSGYFLNPPGAFNICSSSSTACCRWSSLGEHSDPFQPKPLSGSPRLPSHPNLPVLWKPRVKHHLWIVCKVVTAEIRWLLRPKGVLRGARGAVSLPTASPADPQGSPASVPSSAQPQHQGMLLAGLGTAEGTPGRCQPGPGRGAGVQQALGLSQCCWGGRDCWKAFSSTLPLAGQAQLHPF